MGKAGKQRQRGTIRRRGNSFQVVVYAGLDPLTGRRMYLRDSTTDEAEARRIRTRFVAQVDAQQQAKTNATFQVAMDAWLRTHEVDETTRKSYEDLARLHIYPALGGVAVGRVTTRVLEEFYADLRRCRDRCDGQPRIEHRSTGTHECRQVRHRRPPGRRPAAGYPEHDCSQTGCTVVECQQHQCRPLAAGTIRRVHFVVRGALTAAERWGWIPSNPAVHARKPRQPAPRPDPPSASQAAKIAEAAWSQDEDWGTLVWFVMTTGLRRAELLALRWFDLDLDACVVHVRRNYIRIDRTSVEKETKTHRARRLALDAATAEVLREHHDRYVATCRLLAIEPDESSFVFSYRPAHDRPCDPSGVTHRYSKMCARVGIDSHLHALRHYSATELLAAGIDLRTVAGRLGHGGGGATTLRVYAAWVDERDRRAAEVLGGRMQRPSRR